MKVDSYTHTIKVENEDIFGVTTYGAFVMDGASSLTKCHFTPAFNDVVWMVHWWKTYLMENLDALHRPLQSILAQGIQSFNQDFSQYKPVQSLSKLEQVSSGIAIVRKNGTSLECFVLGDVEISLKNTDKSVKILTDDRIQRLDQQVIKLMNENIDREKSIVFKGFTEEEWTLLKKNRMKMNTDEGYYILSHDIEAVSKGIYEVFPIHSIESCLLFSDGMSLLDQFYSRATLIDEINKRGVKSLVNELRNYENDDQAMVKLKRLKTHDDATAVYIQ